MWSKLRLSGVIIVGIVVLIFVLAFMATYTVRFNEVAVKTRFGKVDTAVANSGLWLKFPGVENVIKYDQRARFKESKPETQQTRDDRQVIATAFVTWKIADAGRFFERFSARGSRPDQHYDTAENEVIEKQLRAAMSEISRYRLDELLAPEPGASRLGELEVRMKSRLNATLVDNDGIEILHVGFTALRLPEAVTQTVAERMKAERERLAKQTEATGKATAKAISTKAENDAKTIVAFADTLAGEIRGQGQKEAAQYIAQMQENQQLAVFEKNMEFIREAFKTTRATLILTPSTPGLGLINLNALAEMEDGGIPDGGLSRMLSAPAAERRVTPAAAEDEDEDDEQPGEEAAEPAISRSGS